MEKKTFNDVCNNLAIDFLVHEIYDVKIDSKTFFEEVIFNELNLKSEILPLSEHGFFEWFIGFFDKKAVLDYYVDNFGAEFLQQWFKNHESIIEKSLINDCNILEWVEIKPYIKFCVLVNYIMYKTKLPLKYACIYLHIWTMEEELNVCSNNYVLADKKILKNDLTFILDKINIETYIEALLDLKVKCRKDFSKYIELVFTRELSKQFVFLTEKEVKVVQLRYGILDGKTRTLDEVAISFNVTRERIRQIEVKALNRLRNHFELNKYMLTVFLEPNSHIKKIVEVIVKQLPYEETQNENVANHQDQRASWFSFSQYVKIVLQVISNKEHTSFFIPKNCFLARYFIGQKLNCFCYETKFMYFTHFYPSDVIVNYLLENKKLDLKNELDKFVSSNHGNLYKRTIDIRSIDAICERDKRLIKIDSFAYTIDDVNFEDDDFETSLSIINSHMPKMDFKTLKKEFSWIKKKYKLVSDYHLYYFLKKNLNDVYIFGKGNTMAIFFSKEYKKNLYEEMLSIVKREGHLFIDTEKFGKYTCSFSDIWKENNIVRFDNYLVDIEAYKFLRTDKLRVTNWMSFSELYSFIEKNFAIEPDVFSEKQICKLFAKINNFKINTADYIYVNDEYRLFEKVIEELIYQNDISSRSELRKTLNNIFGKSINADPHFIGIMSDEISESLFIKGQHLLKKADLNFNEIAFNKLIKLAYEFDYLLIDDWFINNKINPFVDKNFTLGECLLYIEHTDINVIYCNKIASKAIISSKFNDLYQCIEIMVKEHKHNNIELGLKDFLIEKGFSVRGNTELPLEVKEILWQMNS